MSTLEDWTDAVVRELGIPELPDRRAAVALVLDLARDVAHGVARPAAPLTAYLLGLAVGAAPDGETAAPELAARVTRLAAGWSAADHDPLPSTATTPAGPDGAPGETG